MIKVKNLTKKYGSNVALDNVSFSVKSGEIAGFLGPNGAGKTTAMNIITGYLSSTSGTVTIDGFDILYCLSLSRHTVILVCCIRSCISGKLHTVIVI